MVRTAITRGNGASTGYSYDAISRLTSLSQTLTGTSQSWTFAYNAQSQITAKTSSNTAFDWNGGYAVIRPYSNNGLNQMTVSGSNSLSYDARGNLTSDGVNSYTYNSVNQLLTRSGGGTATLTYDPLGRLASTVGASTTQFAYSGDQLLSEYDGSGNLLRRYVPGALAADDPIVWYEGAAVNASTRRWLIDDYQGSVVGASDGAGALISGSSPNTYDEYGVPGAANQGRYQYTGQIWIPELGLYHYKARTYSPTLGRFLEADPIGYKDNLDLYEYVGDDPVDHADPTGNITDADWVDIAGDVVQVGSDLLGGGEVVATEGLAAAGPAEATVAEGNALGEGMHATAAGMRASERSSGRPNDFTRATKATVRREEPNCSDCGRPTTSGKADQKGQSPAGDRSEIHHKDPAGQGGSRDRSNAQNMCHDCHVKTHRSGGQSPSSDPQQPPPPPPPKPDPIE